MDLRLFYFDVAKSNIHKTWPLEDFAGILNISPYSERVF